MLRTYSTRIITNGPFAEKQNLVSIYTASVARQLDIFFDLLNAQQIVEQACVNFRNDRLKASPSKAKFHRPM
jgi:hypothetical protein